MPTVNRQRPATPTPTPRTGVRESADVGDAWGATDYIRMLLYGRSGTGKTTFWSTFPGQTLALICSGGQRPGELKSIDTPENRKRIRPVVVGSVARLKELLADAARPGYGYDNVVLDHASGLQDLIIKELLGLDEIPVTKSRAAGKGESWSLVSQQQYGQVAVISKELFRTLLGLPCNVIIVAQERTFGGGEDGTASEVIQPTVGAALTPSVTGWLGPACDFVVQTFLSPRMETSTYLVNGKEVSRSQRGRGVEYCLRTGPHDVYQTKFRMPRGRAELPEYIVDPDYDKVQDLIKGRVAEE